MQCKERRLVPEKHVLKENNTNIDTPVQWHFLEFSILDNKNIAEKHYL